MNTIRTSFLLTSLFLTGGCVTVAPDQLDCGGATVKKINIVYQRHSKITVAPPERRVSPGEAIEYVVKGPVSRDFKAKGTSGPGAFNWLDATGSGSSGGSSHIVCVPNIQELGDYEYLIEINDVGKLDPVVHVE